MLAAKFFDPVIGIDIHIEGVPAPPAPAPIPTPIPNPFVGMVQDFMGAAVGLVISNVIGAVTGSPPTGPVFINSMPAANTGTEAMGFGHMILPPGVCWLPFPKTPKPTVHPGETPSPPNPVMPDDDAVLITGSKTVHIMGSNACRLGDMAMSCSEPVRLPSSVVMAIPMGLPVLIGGPPTLDLHAALGAMIRTRYVSDSLHALVSRLRPSRLRSLLHRAVCFLTGHPVDVASGRVLTDHIDFELPGPLPLRFERVYNSGFANRWSPVGFGWSHSLDQAVWLERGKVVYLTDDGRELEFDVFGRPGHDIAPGDEVYYPVDRLTLRCLGEFRWEVWSADGICRELAPVPGGDSNVAKLVGMRTRDGHRIDLHYDERGRLAWVRDSGGRRIAFEHDEWGRLRKVKLPVSRGEGHYEHMTYGYDANGNLHGVRDALGQQWEFEYAGHLLTREQDRNGLSFYFGYDGIGQDAWCVRTWGDGGIYDHELAYDKQGKVTAVTDSLGRTVLYRMDTAGLVTEVIDPHGHATKYEYDPRNLQRSAEVDALGNATRRTYDERGNVVRVESADGAVSELTYHEVFEFPIRAIGPLGAEWRWEYDSFGRLTAARDPGGSWTRYQYEHALVHTITTSAGATTELQYDDARSVSRVLVSDDAELRLDRDRLGRVVKLVHATGAVERREYDAIGNMTRVEGPTGLVRRFEWDREHNLVRAHDSLRDVRFTYSGYYRLHERLECDARRVFHYDTEDQLTAVENEVGERHVFVRDACGHVREEHDFAGRVRTYDRDAAGRVTRTTTAADRVTTVSYDATGRVTGVVHPDGRADSFAYRTDGVLVEASNHAATVLFERDELGRVVRECTRLPDGTEHWVRSSYNPDGHRIRVQTSHRDICHIERTASGEAARVELEGGHWYAEFEHDAHGREIARRFPNGVECRWQRDELGNPARRTVTSGANGDARTLSDKRYEWTGGEQLHAIVDDATGNAEFKFDVLGRPVRAKLPWGAEEHRLLDAVGNVYRAPDASDRTYEAGGVLEEVEGVVYRHDEDGYLVSRTDVLGDSTVFRWSGAGLLENVALADGRRVEFEYDALARRLARREYEPAGDEDRLARDVRWWWDHHNPITELDTERGRTTWIFAPETQTPLFQIGPDGQVFSVLSDHLGVPTEVVGADANVAWRGEIDLFGMRVETGSPAARCPFVWPGHQYDEPTGLHYNRFRYYDPALGRYISPDPLGIDAGPHAYAYVDDPLAWVDPFGLLPWAEPVRQGHHLVPHSGASHLGVAPFNSQNGVPAYYFAQPYQSGAHELIHGSGPARPALTGRGIQQQGLTRRQWLQSLHENYARPEIQHLRGDVHLVTSSGRGVRLAQNVSPHEAWVVAMRWAREHDNGHGFCGGG